MHVTAIIAAAGRSQRFGGAQPKQLISVGGRAVLERSVSAFLTHPAIDELVVALPDDLAADPPAYLRNTSKPLRIVAGGPRRQDSVANAFAAISDQSDVIVVHDAARPFVTASLIARTVAAAVESGAALAAVPARDTVKQGQRVLRAEQDERNRHAVDERQREQRATNARKPAEDPSEPLTAGAPTGDRWVVKATLPRESIFLAQTPQAFRRGVLRDALALGTPDVDATDEAALAERAGHPVRLVEGDRSNIKITTADDLPLAEAIARQETTAGRSGGEPSSRADAEGISRPASAIRVGVGYDLHRLVEGRPLVLGGVTIPFERGLLGHSDADVVCHAVTDAVLGAAAAGDIGRHFPDADPQWTGASSLDLLKRAAAIVRRAGWDIGNVDAAIIAERPKLAPHIDAMRRNVAEALGIHVDRVSIKGKTNEGVAELGRGEAIAGHAVALLTSAIR